MAQLARWPSKPRFIRGGFAGLHAVHGLVEHLVNKFVAGITTGVALDPLPRDLVICQELVEFLKELRVFKAPCLRFQPLRFQPGIHLVAALIRY